MSHGSKLQHKVYDFYAEYPDMSLISLHIHSMRETICDAQAVCCAQNWYPNFPESSSLVNGMSDQRAPHP